MRILIDIDVPDLSRAIDFYCSALDLKLSRILDDDVAELCGGSSVIYLLQKPQGSTAAQVADAARRYSRHWTPVHMDFVVNDLDKAAERAIKAGAERESDCIRWRGSRCITFSDPFGNGFCLLEFAGETYSDADR